MQISGARSRAAEFCPSSSRAQSSFTVTVGIDAVRQAEPDLDSLTVRGGRRRWHGGASGGPNSLLGWWWSIHQGQDVLFLGVVGKCVEISNLFETTRTIQRIQVMRVGRGEFTRFQVTPSQILVLVTIR